MGRLVIAHHKSYHPYRRDNIERVRRDEEEARLKEEREEGRMLLADAEARIDTLRERANASKPKRRPREDEEFKAAEAAAATASTSGLPLSGGHINFFGDLEQSSIAAAIQASRAASKPSKEKEEEKGVRLAPSEKDLNPWYSGRTVEGKDADDGRRKRDVARKSTHDPLTLINSKLSSNSSSTGTFSSSKRPPPPVAGSSDNAGSGDSQRSERLSRESSERQRALELIRRKKREMAGSETPSTVHGGMSGGYGDVYNRAEVEEAHHSRDHGRGNWRREHGHHDRGWDGKRSNRETRRW